MGPEGSCVLLLLICFFFIRGHGLHRQPLSEEDDPELHTRLGILNKHPVKTVKTVSGDVVDCIDIYKQPAFDHPLLKDHKIQADPFTSSSRSVNGKPKNHTERANLLVFEGCPNGTIPIRRTTKDDSMREKSLWNLVAMQDALPGRRFYAGIDVEDTADIYWEGKATLNIWDPICNDTQLSASIIRLASGNGNLPDENVVYAGWAVYPALYGDGRPRLFTYWQGDGSSGCFDLRCPGFVQTNSRFVLGGPFTKFSEYGGVQQEVVVHISQDQETKQWWLIWANDVLGYWPKELFPGMVNGANSLFFGGLATGESSGLSPPMGSSYFPDNLDVKHSGYMHGIEFSGLYHSFGKPDYNEPSTLVDSPRCYNVKDLGDVDDYGYFILFGGPGGPGC